MTLLTIPNPEHTELWDNEKRREVPPEKSVDGVQDNYTSPWAPTGHGKGEDD